MINSLASSTPLPTELSQVSARVNGALAPLFFVGAPGGGTFQINYQLPFETAAGVALVEVLSEGKLVASEYLMVSAAAPGVFTSNSSGQGQAVALNQDYSLNGSGPGAKPELLAVDGPRGGKIVIFEVREYPIIRAIEYCGLKSVTESEALITRTPTRTSPIRERCRWR